MNMSIIDELFHGSNLVKISGSASADLNKIYRFLCSFQSNF